MKPSETVLPPESIKRGKVIEAIANTIGINLDSTEWMDESFYVTAPWHGRLEKAQAYLLNHEWRVYKAAMILVIFVL